MERVHLVVVHDASCRELSAESDMIQLVRTSSRSFTADMLEPEPVRTHVVYVVIDDEQQ
jgi:hypothetical protein